MAVGALLGDAFIHLIPEALADLGDGAALWILGGMGVFFLLEKFLHWHHHHTPHQGERAECDDCEHHIEPYGKLVVISDVLHNAIDGAIIAAGFLVSPEAGIATTIAVILHEIPQEIGDFAVLLHAGFSRTQALYFNFASALSAFIGALLVFVIGISVDRAIPVISALAAGGFIYIAAADLVPELHRSSRAVDALVQLIAVSVGVAVMFALTALE